ncbi:hypothetical protein SAMN02799624_02508 [Paenibacillus sp. UNC496MF]|uniref:hypothetical protein n=1 Tax=Paenibacillus sp. UNC496MF TaxID=1502753 RepID=UPI0008E310C4|nr:hypothetical protein [Paenibacillus sp. UNC496MF]SFI88816.1 hypothetical protein SAMN02799624_02508 [Paenibacillus sp. UNC496MF]
MYKYEAVVGPNLLYFQIATAHLYEWVAAHFKALEPGVRPDVTETRGAELRITIHDFYGGPYDDEDPVIEDTGSAILYMRSDYKLIASSHYCEAEIYVFDELAMKHALINLYSAFLIHRREGLLVHSSCLIQDDKAYMFAGPSGAGKSTVVELSYPRPILSDEATYLHVESDGAIRVYDSPFRSDVETPCSVPSCALAGILFLNQSPDVYTTPLSKSDAFLTLLDKVFYWKHNRLETANMIWLTKAVVQHASAHQLYFQKNATFWERIS